MQEIFQAGIYARLSVDHGKVNESSIESQVALAQAFIRTQPDIISYQCYIDLGRTGRNFQRQGFLRLMEEIQKGRINCIIVKDFSRLGRDYLETGNYIQNIFPQQNVRLIALDDQYDSLKTNMQTKDTLVTNLKNLTNEMYARDISAKIKSTKKLQKEQGNYMGSIPPYGCMIQWRAKKRCLLAEPVTSDIVKELFERYSFGSSLQELVLWLYHNKIHRPKDYRRYGHVYCLDTETLYEWPKNTLKSLLSNPVYSNCFYEDAGGTKEMLLSKEQFLCAAKRLENKQNKQNKHKNSQKQPDLFAGILYCGCCQNKLERTYHSSAAAKGRQEIQYGYFCPNSTKIDARFCERKYLRDATLRQIVLAALRIEIAFCKHEAEYFLQMAQAIDKLQEKGNRNLAALQKEIDRKKRQESTWYAMYQSRKIAIAEFRMHKQQLEEEIAQIKKKREEIQVQLNRKIDENKQFAEQLQQLFYRKKECVLAEKLVAGLVKKIAVFPGRRLTVTFCFPCNFTFPVDKNM